MMTRTTAGVLAMVVIIAAAFLLGRCSAPDAAAAPVAEPVEIVHVSHDTDAATAQALADLTAFVQSTSTTTTVARITPRVTSAPRSEADFFACVRWRESRGDYTAVNPTGTFRGAYQFYQVAWDSFAPEGWQGVDPASAPPAVQDETAHNAYAALGARPWGGACS